MHPSHTLDQFAARRAGRRAATLVELLRRRARSQPSRRAYTFLAEGEREEGFLTCGGLDLRARAIAAAITEAGAAGRPVALVYPPGLDFIAAFFGCLYAGSPAVPAYPPGNSRNSLRLRAIVEDANAALGLTTSALTGRIERSASRGLGLDSLRWLATDNVPGSFAGQWRDPQVDRAAIALLQYTSGSTATPKGVMVTHGNLLQNEEAIARAFGQSGKSVIVSWLPLYHDMGLIGGVLQPLYLGAHCVLMSPLAFLQRPFRWLNAISRYRASTSGGPNFAYELCVSKIPQAERELLDLRSWNVAFNGAEPVRSETLERFVAAFGPCGFRADALRPCYGLAEATLMVAGASSARPPVVRRVQEDALKRNQISWAADGDGVALVASGQVAHGQRVRIVDPETKRPALPSNIGEIWVSGGSVAHGYWNRPAETESAFRAQVADGGNGCYLRTGDLGFLEGQDLYVTGRLKDLIILRGLNYYPHDIERTAEQSHSGLRPGCGAAFTMDDGAEERLVVLQEIEHGALADAGEALGSIRHRVAEAHDVTVAAVVLLRAGRLPKTSSGKIERRACREAFLAGTLDPVAEWRETSGNPSEEGPTEARDEESQVIGDAAAAESWLVSTVAVRFHVEPEEIDRDAPISRYGVDSLGAVELAHRMETRGGAAPLASILEGASIARLAREMVECEAPDPLPAGPAGNLEFPLSKGQQALWLLHAMDPESPAYNLAVAARCRTPLDCIRLRRAVNLLASRHPALKTVFSQSGNGQRLEEGLEIEVQPRDASSWTVGELEAHTAEAAWAPFDLDEPPLLRVRVFVRSAAESILVIAAHHAVADFWSLAVFLRELGELYSTGTGAMTMPRLPSRYSDFVRWQEGLLRGPDGERLWEFWKNQLAGELAGLNLPAVRPRQAVQTRAAGCVRAQLGGEVLDGLVELSRAAGVTLYAALLAAWQATLSRYTGQDDILVASPALGRPRAAFSGVIGYFANPIVLRGNLAGDPTFRELLGRASQAVSGAVQHQDYPFPLLVERLQPLRDAGKTPLVQVLFTFLSAHSGYAAAAPFAAGESGAVVNVGGLELESIALARPAAEFELELMVAEADGRLFLALQYNQHLYDESTAHRLLRHFCTLIDGARSAPDLRISELPLLSAPELREVLRDWNATTGQYPDGDCIHDLIEAQAARTPEALAVSCGTTHWTYRELMERANGIAHRLTGLGVGPDMAVGVFLERSAGMLAAMLGVWKAGGAYVPLDPSYPEARLGWMLEDAQATVVLTDEELASKLPASAAKVVRIDHAPSTALLPETHALKATARPENLAYIIYTSGSTGKPKGVMISHRNVVNFLAGMDDELRVEGPGEWLAVTSISFDISVLELFWTLARGFHVIVETDRNAPGAAGRRGRAAVSREIDFSLFYFASDAASGDQDRYRLLLEGARFADRNGFQAVWTPERHFHTFGGLFPNPAVTGAALAAITERVHIRAGSVVLPLHDPLRVAEEWSVIDNLSGGRAGISFASGWHADDFVLAPESYAARKERMFQGIEIVRKLWRGESVERRNGAGKVTQVRTLPKPRQAELPVWLTAAGSEETFRAAGEIGAGLLTHLLGQSVEELASRIVMYREAWRRAGHGGRGGHVTLMVHTYVGQDLAAVRERVRAPFCGYLRDSVGLIQSLARGLGKELSEMTEADMDGLLAHAFDRYFGSSGLMGTVTTCLEMVEKLRVIEVDEIACLIDFGIDTAAVLESLKLLAEVRSVARERATQPRPAPAITHLQCTPSMAQMMLADPESGSLFAGLQQLLLGGEPLPPALARELASVTPAVIHNMYGPTETTIWSSSDLVTDAEITLGRPILNTQIYLLDRYFVPVPPGAPGEICIGGAGVGRGYFHRPAATAEKFIPDPFSAELGARLYRTGDQGRFRSGGKIESLGRLDQQVKIRGHRIETGEVEAVACEHPGVAEAAVVCREGPGGKRLICFVAPKPGSAVSEAGIRTHLQERLPEYMAPAVVVTLDSLPRTPNGKLDRRALPDPRPDAAGADRVAPETPLEVALVELWREFLGREQVGIHDNFFSLGGHSLMAAQLIARVREIFAIELPLNRLFEHPTVAGLSQRMHHDFGDAVDRSAELLCTVSGLSEEEAEAMLAE